MSQEQQLMNVTEANKADLTQLEKAVYGTVTCVFGVAGMLLTVVVASRFYRSQKSSFAIIILHLGASDGIGLFLFSTNTTALIVGNYNLLRDLSPSTTLFARFLQFVMNGTFYASLLTTGLMALNRYSAVVSGPKYKWYFTNLRLAVYFIIIDIVASGVAMLLAVCGCLFDREYMTYTYLPSCPAVLYPIVFTFNATLCGGVFVLNIATLYKMKTYRKTRERDERAKEIARKENRFFYATLFNCVAIEVILVSFFIISPRCGTNRVCNYIASTITNEAAYYTNAVALVVVARESLRKTNEVGASQTGGTTGTRS